MGNDAVAAAAPAAPAAPLTLEQKIVAAAAQAEQVVAIFSPAAAAMVQAGVDIEPVISALAKGIIGLFTKHVTAAAA